MSEMNDRELLELAAKAYTGGHMFGFDDKGNALIDPVVYWPFNPLKSDGDALRLAVKLGIIVDTYRLSAISGSRLVAGHNDWTHVYTDGCRSDEQAVRYAITKVAAEIGRKM